MDQADIPVDEGKRAQVSDPGDNCPQPSAETVSESTPNVERDPQVLGDPKPAPEANIKLEQGQSIEPNAALERPAEDHPPISQDGVKQVTAVAENIEVQEKKKKEDDKLSIYKALAIKLKKELVKSREEQKKLEEDSNKECNSLKAKVILLDETLNNERIANATNTLTLEANIKGLKQQLESSESDLQVLQNDYESYKVRASKIMQQNSQVPFNRTFEDERYKQLKELNDEQAKRITSLESQLSRSLDSNKDLTEEVCQYQKQLKLIQEDVKLILTLDNKCETLSRENENLKTALKQFRTKLKEPANGEIWSGVQEMSKNGSDEIGSARANTTADSSPTPDERLEDTATRLSPSASVKDGSQTNSSSSFDGYVHIKPTTFEIVSRNSVLEDAQNQIDNLTKAYLDSESTNSLLSEQVRALKEEIRRMQRVSDRMELAENLEYLKNVVFKFLSLDSNQIEQKQRLVPVLSTVLKLSPDETAKLHSSAFPDKTSMASSFFKL